MNWSDILKFDTDEQITELWAELYRKVNAGIEQFNDKSDGFSRRLGYIAQILRDKDYDDNTIHNMNRQLDKIVDYLEVFPDDNKYPNMLSLQDDIRETSNRFGDAFARRVNFLLENE